jgi:Zn-dependent peptidase ImmA (M78 family)/transcriptional regulator with XRE-family HTH domain
MAIRTSVIYGERIKQARELNNLTQSELAKRVGCNQSAIAHFENDRTLPSNEILKAIAEITGVLPRFFEREPTYGFSLGSLSYRSRRSLTKKEEAKAYQYAFAMYEQARYLSGKLSFPPLRLPRVSERPILSARVTRASLGLAPDKPISRLVNTFEYNGGLVFVTPFPMFKIDAFSGWATLDIDRPIIIVSCNIPGDRMRFSVAHEIGHLVMHAAPKGTMIVMEKEANAFAAEFLMPEDTIESDLLAPITLTSIAQLKPKWGVSMQALIYRAHDLKIITDRQYRYLFEQLSAKGWRTREPSNLDVPIEAPQAFSKMVQSVYQSIEAYAEDMDLKPSVVRDWLLYN